MLLLLCAFKKIEWARFGNLLEAGFLFKVLIAICDTPFLYIGVYFYRKRFNLKPGEELGNDIAVHQVEEKI